MPQVQVATLENSASATYLASRGIGFQGQTTLTNALEGVIEERFDAVVYDEPILQYLSSHQYSGQLQVLPNSFERQD